MNSIQRQTTTTTPNDILCQHQHQGQQQSWFRPYSSGHHSTIRSNISATSRSAGIRRRSRPSLAHGQSSGTGRSHKEHQTQSILLGEDFVSTPKCEIGNISKFLTMAPPQNSIWIRCLIVCAYFLFVSSPALFLSYYYTKIWDPTYINKLDLKPSARGNVIQVQRKERELTDKDASADTKNENFTPPLKISSSPVKTAGTLNATRSSEIFTTQSTLKDILATGSRLFTNG